MKIGLVIRIILAGVVFASTPALCSKLEAADPMHDQLKVRELLRTLPEDDVMALDLFFHQLFASDSFAYTLFGDKPMAVVDCMPLMQLQFHPSKNGLRYLAIMHRGIKVWKKYQHLFPLNRFSFIGYEKPDYSVFGLALFDRDKVHNLYQQHSDLFDPIFGGEEGITRALQMSLEEWNETCKNMPAYHTCIGLLLGFGVNNSQTFGRKVEVHRLLRAAPFHLENLNTKDAVDLLSRHKNQIGPVETLSTFDLSHDVIQHSIEHLNALRLNYKFQLATQREKALSPIDVIGFGAVLNDPDMLHIQDAFDSIRQRLVEIYYSEDFLEIILTQLTS